MTRGLFLGKLHSESTFPYPARHAISKDKLEELSLFVEPVRAFFTSVNDAAANDENASIPPNVRKGLADLGAYGLQVPESYSGLGLSNTGYARLVEEVGAADLGIAVHLGAHQSIGFKGILLFGTPAQKIKYLPALAAGAHIASFALTEPSMGSDTSACKTRAVLDADGKTWRLTGGKMWISNGGQAEIFTVFAQTLLPDPKGVPGAMKDKLTAFIVERAFGGVTHGPPEKKMGIKCSNTAQVYFDATPVPAENVIGSVGGGFKVAMETLNNGRFGMGAALTGAIKALLAGAATHAAARVQFGGRKIQDYGAIQAKIAGIAVRCYGAESLAFALAANMDRGMVDYALEAAALKVYASDAAWWAADETIQTLGGLGFMKTLPFERMTRDLRIFRIFEGTNDILKLLIAGQGLQAVGELLKKEGIFGVGVRAFQARFLGRAPSAPGALAWAPASLSASAKAIEKATSAFGDAVVGLVIVHRQGLIEQQMVLTRVADVAIDLTVASVALSRAAESAKTGSAEAAAEADLANLAVLEAIVRIVDAMMQIKAHSDAAYKSSVTLPKPDWRRIEELRIKVSQAVCKKGGYTAGYPLGF